MSRPNQSPHLADLPEEDIDHQVNNHYQNITIGFIYSMFHKTGCTGISELECMSQNIQSIYSNKQSFRVKDQILQREECELLTKRVALGH